MRQTATAPIQPQLQLLTEKSIILDNMAFDLSDKQKYLIELGYGDFDTFKFSLKQNLGNSNIKEVLNNMLSFLTKFSNEYQNQIDELILFNSRINDIEFKSRGGMISFDTESIERQKINKAILDLINNIAF